MAGPIALTAHRGVRGRCRYSFARRERPTDRRRHREVHEPSVGGKGKESNLTYRAAPSRRASVFSITAPPRHHFFVDSHAVDGRRSARTKGGTAMSHRHLVGAV